MLKKEVKNMSEEKISTKQKVKNILLKIKEKIVDVSIIIGNELLDTYYFLKQRISEKKKFLVERRRYRKEYDFPTVIDITIDIFRIVGRNFKKVVKETYSELKKSVKSLRESRKGIDEGFEEFSNKSIT